MNKCACSGCHTQNDGIAVEENESHGHGGEITSVKQDVFAIIMAIVIFASTFFTPDGIIKTLLYIAAITNAGAPIFMQGIKNIVKLDLDELALLTVAVTAACLIGEMPEALMVTLLFRAGEMLEGIAVARSRREVEAVTNIIPDNANLLLPDASVQSVSAKALRPGNRIRIKSGERVPVDCVVLSGASSVDSSSLTGESAPIEVFEGDNLLSGTVNLGGVLTCEAISAFDDSTAGKIVRMVKDSAAKKGQTERMISRFARIYTPIVMIAAVLVAVLPPLLGFGSFTMWIGRSLVFLVASCPCALVIATPLAFFAGIGACSKQGILVKGSKYLEVLANARSVVFDKTGTLTTGELTVDEIFTADGFSIDDVLRLAAICESESNHPIAKAVVSAAPKSFPRAESCEEITAYGMRAMVGGEEILCGSERLMQKFSVDISEFPAANVYVAKASKAVGAVSLFDAPRDDAAEMLEKLRGLGVERAVMLTGDSEVAAKKTAKLIGITEIHAGLLPADKVERFSEVKSETTNGKVLFLGDGINDSPVIAAADAGLAMGAASDAAIEAADVALLSNRLSSLPQSIDIAKRTVRIASFNIAFALIVKLMVFILAFFGLAGMWLAVFADVGVSILSVLNATRALRFR